MLSQLKRSSSARLAQRGRSSFRLHVATLEDLTRPPWPLINFAATITFPALAMNATLYFSASDTTHGNQLWKSDGTASGTSMVKDINAGTVGSVPSHVTQVRGSL